MTDRFQLVELTYLVCALIERNLWAFSISYIDIVPVWSPTTIASPDLSKLIDVIFDPFVDSSVMNGLLSLPRMS